MKRKAQVHPPEGFRYQTDVLPVEEENEILKHIQELPLKEFEFHGYTGKRRVLSYGWRYDFEDRSLRPTDEIPAFLQRVVGDGFDATEIYLDSLKESPQQNPVYHA